jgi:hypothetical protein
MDVRQVDVAENPRRSRGLPYLLRDNISMLLADE